VTPLALFFDLVYVFAIGQLSHHLLEHVDLRTGAETVIMTLAVVYAWYMTAWGDPRGRHRAAHADRRDRRGDRRARRGGYRRHGPRERSGAHQGGVAALVA
jgi:hypothetical protein